MAEGQQKKIEQNPIWRYHPPARRHVFDAVQKHGWPSAPCHGANMAKKKNFKTTPVKDLAPAFYVSFAPSQLESISWWRQLE